MLVIVVVVVGSALEAVVVFEEDIFDCIRLIFVWIKYYYYYLTSKSKNCMYSEMPSDHR